MADGKTEDKDAMKNTDLEEIRRATPYIRTGAAFVLFLAGKAISIREAYVQADEFMGSLIHDVKAGPQ